MDKPVIVDRWLTSVDSELREKVIEEFRKYDESLRELPVSDWSSYLLSVCHDMLKQAQEL